MSSKITSKIIKFKSKFVKNVKNLDRKKLEILRDNLVEKFLQEQGTHFLIH